MKIMIIIIMIIIIMIIITIIIIIINRQNNPGICSYIVHIAHAVLKYSLFWSWNQYNNCT